MNISDIQKLANESIKRGEPSSWFEKLYAQSKGDTTHVPWADLHPNSYLVEWLNKKKSFKGKALVIGCGLGDDAEALANHGFQTSSFDISPTAIEWCKKRFPKSSVHYMAYDLFKAPKEWHNFYDFVFEAFTIQALPVDLRQKTIESIAKFVAPHGKLVVICSGIKPNQNFEGPPWPLLQSDLDSFVKAGLRKESIEEKSESNGPLSMTFVASFEGPA